YDKSSEGIFEQASYDDDGVITDFNNLSGEVNAAKVNTGEVNAAEVNTGEEERVQRRKGKEPMTEEDLQAEVQASKT
ncbi:hypothetical protein Tco_0643189, partial [Tanacetum coccineum]